MVKSKSKSLGYNERLFSGAGLRAYLHKSRFKWVEATLNRLQLSPQNVVELGCFDGRLLTHLPSEPSVYFGFDADWEGGLTQAQNTYKDHPQWQFIKSVDPKDLEQTTPHRFDLAVALETMEHIAPDHVDAYLAELAKSVDGTLLISVPNEKGLVFITKWLLKKLMFGGAETYTKSELWNAVVGRLDRVERNEHKGFDHQMLVKNIAQHFDIQRVEAIPIGWLPLSFAFTVGIIATPKS